MKLNYQTHLHSQHWRLKSYEMSQTNRQIIFHATFVDVLHFGAIGVLCQDFINLYSKDSFLKYLSLSLMLFDSLSVNLSENKNAVLI